MHKLYPIHDIRADFPILSQQVYGKPLVYLDNAASAQKPRAVIDAMSRVMETGYANVHRGLHYMANQATESFEQGRESVRAFFNAASSDEIIFTRSATEAINLVADSFGRLINISEGDEIVVSIMEHHSNIVPWHFHKERRGAVLRWIPVDEDGAFHIEELEKLLNERTKIVAITHMSNVLGTLTPIKEIVALCHERGIPVLVDGSQAAVHIPVDVQDLGADFYVCTGHKLYGPTGIGVLYAKREWLEKLPPYLGGGEMISAVTQDGVTYNDPPHKFEAGTPAIVEAVGLGAALNYMKTIGRDAIAEHEKALSDYAHKRFYDMNFIRIFGSTPTKGAIIAFEMIGAHAHDVATLIDRSGVAVRAGTHCTMPLMQRFGVSSTCRASFGMYNTFEEVDVLCEALIKAHRMLC